VNRPAAGPQKIKKNIFLVNDPIARATIHDTG